MIEIGCLQFEQGRDCGLLFRWRWCFSRAFGSTGLLFIPGFFHFFRLGVEPAAIGWLVDPAELADWCSGALKANRG